MIGSERTGPLISVADLHEEMEAGRPPVLLDVRWALAGPPGRADFAAGHLPGAVFVDLDADLAGPPGSGRGRHPLPARDDFQEAMRRAGVGHSAVVVYDAGGGLSAARAWWLLRYFGHPDARLLDGGLAAWTADGHPVTTELAAPRRGDFTARAGAMAVLDAHTAAALARDGVLLDARAAVRYRGETEPVDHVAGHIPGARSAPTTANLSADGRFLAPARLAERFAGLGVGSAPGDPARPTTGAYCGSGVTAAHQVLALEIAGIPAALYPGSWSEWISDPARPVATGPDPG